MASPSPDVVELRLSEHLAAHPQLANRIFRQLLLELHARGIVTVDAIYEHTLHLVAASTGTAGEVSETETSNKLIREHVVRNFTPEQVDEAVALARKREEAESLRSIVSLPSLSFRVLADRVRRFCALPPGSRTLEPEEVIGIRVGLIRHLVSDQLEFIGVAKHYLTIRDLDHIVLRIIGPEHGIGRIGGKAAGMYLAYKVLTTKPPALTDAEPAVARSSPPPRAPLAIAIPDSYFLRSDVIDEFLELNGLGEYQNQKYKSAEEIRAQYPLIKQEFRKGKFPAAVVERLRQLLLAVGNAPLIVRSSSLLEDRFGTAFSGKYASIFVPNQNKSDLRSRIITAQGRVEQRLKILLQAIAEVYASALAPDPLLYRRANDLIDYPEDMGVLIQRVLGSQHGPYFLPAFAGVAFSRNEYQWSPRIRREDGLMRIVLGMGTRAIERVGNEYPRMVALGEPTLRPESTPLEIIRNAQRTIDVINLPANKFESVQLEALLSAAPGFPMLDKLISIKRDGGLYTPTGTFVSAEPRELVVTFDKLLRETDFCATMRDILHRLEEAYRRPVDVEFAHDGNQLYILQCRTLTEPAEFARQRIPQQIPDHDVVFRAVKFVRTGLVDKVEYVIYVSPEAYDALPTREQRVEVGRAIGSLNDALEKKNFILIGPGRWGSNDILLGVPVTYADINHSRMLIEVARERDGYVPEVSFGTHFFQDLIEANIHYLPLYPDDPACAWNRSFFGLGENELSRLVPKRRELASVIRVLRVPSIASGRTLRVVMDGNEDAALAYLC